VGYYDLSKEQRDQLYNKMKNNILHDIVENELDQIKKYASDDDIYIRKNTYLIIGRMYHLNPAFHDVIIEMAKGLLSNENEKIRQTMVNCLGEIGKIHSYTI
jgi:hypothetical protein